MRIAMAVVCLLGACVDVDAIGGPDASIDGTLDDALVDVPPDGPPPAQGAPTAAELLLRVSTCNDPVGGPYAPGNGAPADIDICGFPNAVVWQADLDVDCDGRQTPQCNPQTDPYFMNQTAATDSSGDPLDAAALPFVVIPGRSTRFDYRVAGLAMGTVVAVIYGDRVEYGPLGDVGPTAIIGEASYRMAEILGIDPDPSSGGVAGGVTYIAFTGDPAKLMTIEDHAEATEVGIALAEDLLATP